MKLLIIHLSHKEADLPREGQLFRYPDTFVKALSTEPLSGRELGRVRQVVTALETQQTLLGENLE